MNGLDNLPPPPSIPPPHSSFPHIRIHPPPLIPLPLLSFLLPLSHAFAFHFFALFAPPPPSPHFPLSPWPASSGRIPIHSWFCSSSRSIFITGSFRFRSGPLYSLINFELSPPPRMQCPPPAVVFLLFLLPLRRRLSSSLPQHHPLPLCRMGPQRSFHLRRFLFRFDFACCIWRKRSTAQM